MAVWILGELQSAKAVPPLTALLKRTESYQLKGMILDALDKYFGRAGVEMAGISTFIWMADT